MKFTTTQQLARFGPGQADEISPAESEAWCAQFARSHSENFHVLTRLVPADMRPAFAAVYAFCRWADDLGDEMRSPERSIELLRWWKGELEACYRGESRHPIYVALRPIIDRHGLPMNLFADLIDAFIQDQTVSRYQTWDELLGYCRKSADPVGRLVLMLFGEIKPSSASPDEPSREKLRQSDAVCTALQLTNHWQDVRRDILDRDRIYIPADMNPIDDFEARLKATARQGYGCDRRFLGQSRDVIRACVQRTWPLFEDGAQLVSNVGPAARPVIWLFAAGGMRTLRLIELWNHETVVHRPKLGAAARFSLLARAFAGRLWPSRAVAAGKSPEASLA